MPVDVVVLWQEAAEGKVWRRQGARCGHRREHGNNKRTGKQQENMAAIRYISVFAKKKLSGGSVTKLSVSSVPKTVTKEDANIMGRTTTNIGKGRGVDRSSGEQGHSQGSVLGSSDIVGLKSNQQHTLMG
ncbi:hypothetical protein HanIR_Chr01g0041401 [Helianthus annuus]|nr:hypothetical protein HanIR_Chr01g0041401 [Helianthus annuus]